MKQQIIKWKYFPALAIVFVLILLVGCQDNTVEPINSPNSIITDKSAITEAIQSDSLLSSFESNYNEEGSLDYFGKSSTEILPFKVWQRMKLINRNIDVNINGDTAYAHITNTFDGTLFILASNDSAVNRPDTVVKKPFTSVITRNVILTRNTDTTKNFRKWMISAVSLPMGGTQSSDISIKKLTVYLPNGDSLVVNNPNDYYLVRNWKHWWRWHNVPIIQRNSEVKVRIELTSNYSDDDYVSLTFGADRFGFNRSKKLFNLVSSEQNGGIYNKVYEQTFRANLFPGFFHAIINALPKQVVNDDSTPVELDSWGIPYLVKL